MSRLIHRPLLGSSSGPAPLGWEVGVPVDAVGDSIISTEGTFVEAYSFGRTAGGLTINGVTFTEINKPVGLSGQYWNGANYVLGGIGASFEAAMDGFAWGGASDSFDLSGLTPGETYLLQVALSDARAAYNDRELTYSIAGHTSAPTRNGDAASLICRFVATSTTETLTIVCVVAENGSGTAISLYQLRHI